MKSFIAGFFMSLTVLAAWVGAFFSYMVFHALHGHAPWEWGMLFILFGVLGGLRANAIVSR